MISTYFAMAQDCCDRAFMSDKTFKDLHL